MSRYTGPAYKKSRRLGFSTLESGKELAKRPYAPGQHGTDRKKKSSEYGTQLQEKQKVRLMYGLTEKQFRKTFDRASRMKGVAGENLLKLLESRLDNLVYRMGMANTRRASRQLVNHGHILVNGKKVDIPSYQVKPGDVIEIKEKHKSAQRYKDILEVTEGRIVPDWLEADHENLSGTVKEVPTREQIDVPVNEVLIVELYSK